MLYFISYITTSVCLNAIIMIMLFELVTVYTAIFLENPFAFVKVLPKKRVLCPTLTSELD